jgi:hypothetical protein
VKSTELGSGGACCRCAPIHPPTRTRTRTRTFVVDNRSKRVAGPHLVSKSGCCVWHVLERFLLGNNVSLSVGNLANVNDPLPVASAVQSPQRTPARKQRRGSFEQHVERPNTSYVLPGKAIGICFCFQLKGSVCTALQGEKRVGSKRHVRVGIATRVKGMRDCTAIARILLAALQG